MAEWYAKNIDEQRAKHRAYHGRNREAINENSRRYRSRLRAEAIAAYGGFCTCCGESTPEFLCFDHVNGGGNKHRKETGIGMGNRLYIWMKRNNYPDTFQVLCHNCNMAKGFYGRCPHQEIHAKKES